MTLLLAAYLMNPDPQSLGGTSDTQVIRVPFDAQRWTLDWSDEFDAGSAPDPKKWDYEEGYLRNNEEQYYTRDRRENARIENGRLIIEARRDNWHGKEVTSASLVTRGRKYFRYGRIEIKAKVPPGRGTWPAFWTLGQNIGEVGWPKCGEIDILEYVGFEPDKVHANVHTDAYNHMKRNGKGNALAVKAPHADFHVYAVEWYPDRLEFFFNDQRYLVYRNEGKGESSWPFDQPHYVILNLAIGGAWGGVQGIDDAIYPARYEVDYVRYYRAAKP